MFFFIALTHSYAAVVVLPMIVSPEDRTSHTNTQSTNGVNPYTKRETDEKEK